MGGPWLGDTGIAWRWSVQGYKGTAVRAVWGGGDIDDCVGDMGDGESDRSDRSDCVLVMSDCVGDMGDVDCTCLLTSTPHSIASLSISV